MYFKENEKYENRENKEFVNTVMHKIKAMSELDKSKEMQNSKEYYQKHGTFEGIEEYLSKFNDIPKKLD